MLGTGIGPRNNVQWVWWATRARFPSLVTSLVCFPEYTKQGTQVELVWVAVRFVRLARSPVEVAAYHGCPLAALEGIKDTGLLVRGARHCQRDDVKEDGCYGATDFDTAVRYVRPEPMSEGSVPVICVLGLRHEPGCVRSKRATKNRVLIMRRAEPVCAYFRFDDETQTLAAKQRCCIVSP